MFFQIVFIRLFECIYIYLILVYYSITKNIFVVKLLFICKTKLPFYPNQMNLESIYIDICFHIIEFAYLRITDIDLVFRSEYSVNVSLKEY